MLSFGFGFIFLSTYVKHMLYKNTRGVVDELCNMREGRGQVNYHMWPFFSHGVFSDRVERMASAMFCLSQTFGDRRVPRDERRNNDRGASWQIVLPMLQNYSTRIQNFPM